PREKRGQNSRRNAGINRRRIRSTAGEYLFQFVNPEDAWRESLGHFENPENALFSFPNVLVENGGSIELDQWQVPFAGDRACTKRFPAALHAENDHAFRRFQSELARRSLP